MMAVRETPPRFAVLLTLALCLACAAPATRALRPVEPAAAAAPASGPSAPVALQKVDVCTPGTSQGFAGLGIALHGGYFAELGLDVSVYPLPGVACTQALSSNNLQFSGAPNSLDAIVRGLPLRILYLSQNRLGHQLAVAPRIRTWADLKGGRIAVSSLASLSENVAREILQDQGMNPDEDVTFVGLGTPNHRLAAILAGAVEATVLSAQEVPMARAEGFETLPYTQRTSLGAPIAVNEELLRGDPSLVQRFVKGVLMGHLLYAQRKATAMPILFHFLETQDPAYEEQVYELIRPTWTSDGTLTEQQMRDVIASARKATKVERDLPPDEVFDFQFVRRAYQELQAENWEGLWTR